MVTRITVELDGHVLMIGINWPEKRLAGMGAAKEHLAALLPQILASKDAIEGMMSFTQRREPAFKGK